MLRFPCNRIARPKKSSKKSPKKSSMKSLKKSLKKSPKQTSVIKREESP